MAVEAKRGCGFRKVGGVYLVDEGGGMPCCKMPLALTVCPCCGGGIKQARGWTWVDAGKLFASGGCSASGETVIREIVGGMCPAANPAMMGKVGLVWIGEKFYPTPADFLKESSAQGISRRISRMPRDYEAGKTWVLFAHPKAIPAVRLVEEKLICATAKTVWIVTMPDRTPVEGEPDFEVHEDALRRAHALDDEHPLFSAGVIRIARPRGFELIVKQSMMDGVLADAASYEASTDENREKSALLQKFERDRARGLVWIPVPDDDPDHQGTVYDKKEDEE